LISMFVGGEKEEARWSSEGSGEETVTPCSHVAGAGAVKFTRPLECAEPDTETFLGEEIDAIVLIALYIKQLSCQSIYRVKRQF
jgi:hypothetical protein